MIHFEFPEQLISPRPRILLIKLRSIGDVIYNTAVYSAIKAKWPDSHLTVVVEAPSDELVESHPAVDTVLCFRKKPFREQIKFYWGLLKSQWDIAIDMHEGPRGAFMTRWSGARFRVGHKLAKRSFMYNVRLGLEEFQPKYPIDYQVALIRKMGGRFDGEPAPAIYLPDSAEKYARELLVDHGIAWDEPFCIVHPGTKRVYDQWQYEKFASLIASLQADFKLKVVLTTGPGQEHQVQKVMQYASPKTYVYFQTSLKILAALSRQARFAVCHNGGFMHLVAAMGTPVVAFFGPVSPNVWKPQGSGHAIMYSGLECSPCNKQTRKPECYQGDAECKRLITVEEVLEKVEAILKR